MNGPRLAELISTIAHDLRSPLTSVQGFSGTLVKRWDRFTDDQKRQLVETIHSDAVRMGRMISEVVDLARLETGAFQLSCTQVDVASIVERARDNVARLPGAERIELRVQPELTAWADATRLEHIVTNLVENAVKYSSEGAIQVGARSVDGEVEIEVRDEGDGIAADRLPTIFSGPVPSHGGAAPSGGLGLYLTKLLVEAHRGTVSATSEPGKGSRFVVRLPAGPD